MRTVTRFAAIFFIACDDEGHLTAADRVLDGFAYVDAGAVAVNDRQVFTVPLFSKASQVRVFEIATEDVTVPPGAVSPAFLVDDSTWADACDSDADGLFDCRDLAEYTDDSDDDTLPLQVVFAPTVKGYYEALLTIWSNDNTSTEVLPLPGDETREWAIWRVQLRGLADYACGRVYPDYVDFGPRNVGGDFSALVTLVNCGIVPLTIAEFQIAGDGLEPRTLVPLSVQAGRTAEVSIGWRVPSAAAVDGALSFVSNSDALGTAGVRVVGNSCENSLSPASWDNDFDGWSACGGDCEDDDPDSNPSRNELVGDGVDNDCDGELDELDDDSVNDDDDDGCSEAGTECGGVGDCDDNDPLVGPDADEVFNLRDDDCDALIDEGTEAYDDDGDGWNELEGDCDDTDPLVSLTGIEIVDGRDNNCNGTVDEGGPSIDDDRDGYKDVESDFALNDCDDEDPWVYVGAREYCDGYDNDCDRLVDDGEADEANGACQFQPTRSNEGNGLDSGDAGGSGGCATGGLGVSLFGVVAGLALVRRRTRAYR